jgi:protein SCO1/2
MTMLRAFGFAALVFGASPSVARADQLPVPSMTGHFALHTVDGRDMTDASFHGRWMLVYFGYTYCPDVCPTVLNEIGVALNEVGPLAKKIQPVFITIDPARDNATVLKKYLASFDPRIMGLRGDGEETEAAAKSFHVYYRPHALGHGQYTYDHSGYLYLIDPKGKFVSLITANVPSHQIAQELKKDVK